MLEAKTMAFTSKILEYIKFVLIMKAFLTGGKFHFHKNSVWNQNHWKLKSVWFHYQNVKNVS